MSICRHLHAEQSKGTIVLVLLGSALLTVSTGLCGSQPLASPVSHLGSMCPLDQSPRRQEQPRELLRSFPPLSTWGGPAPDTTHSIPSMSRSGSPEITTRLLCSFPQVTAAPSCLESLNDQACTHCISFNRCNNPVKEINILIL